MRRPWITHHTTLLALDRAGCIAWHNLTIAPVVATNNEMKTIALTRGRSCNFLAVIDGQRSDTAEGNTSFPILSYFPSNVCLLRALVKR